MKKETDLAFPLMIKIASLSFVIGSFMALSLFSEPTKNKSPKQINPPQNLNLESGLRQSILYFKRMPKDTKIRFLEEEYTNGEVLRSLVDLYSVVLDASEFQIQTEIKKRFQLIELRPSDGPPTITGYYEIRIHGKTKPEGEYQYPALSPPLLKQTNAVLENPIHFSRERWNEKSLWEKYSKPIVFLRLTDLHLAQLEGSALIQTETNELFRINYAADNGQNYISPSVYLKGICPSLKPYHLFNCIQSNPKEVTEAILKNPRYIFFEKETQANPKIMEEELGPLGSGGIRLVAFRSVAMDKKIPLGFPVLLSFRSSDEQANDRLVFVHDRGNAITGEGRLDYYLGSGKGVEAVANNLLTKGKVTLLLPKKEKPRREEQINKKINPKIIVPF